MEDLRTIPRHEHFCCGLSNLAPKEKIGYSGYIEEDAGQHEGLFCVLLFFVTKYFILLVMGGPRLLVNNNKTD